MTQNLFFFLSFFFFSPPPPNTHQFSVFQISVTMSIFIKSLDELFNVSFYTFLHKILSMSNRRTGNFAFDKCPQQLWFCKLPTFQKALVLSTTELFKYVTTTALFMYTALVWTTGSVIMQTTNTITLSLRINRDTYPTFAIAFSTYNMTNPSATMALFHWGSMRHFNKLLLIPEHLRGLGFNIPWEGSWSILCTIHLTSRVRNKFPRCFTFLCESLQLILKLIYCLYGKKEKNEGNFSFPRQCILLALYSYSKKWCCVIQHTGSSEMLVLN